MSRPVAAFHRPELDALRFGAFLLVFVSHYLPPRGGFVAHWPAVVQLLPAIRDIGAYGVDLFFLLSAYLITEILLREQTRTGTIDIGAFLARRVLRIWPLYFTFLAAAYWVIPMAYTQRFPASLALPYAFFVGNFAAMTPPPGELTVAGILWSVSIEEQFYLTWPFLTRTLRTHLPLLCGMLLVVATGTRAVYVWQGWPLAHLWLNTLTRLDPIAVGALMAVWLNGRTPTFGGRARIGIVAVGAGLLVATGVLFPREVTPLVAYPSATLAVALLLCGTLGRSDWVPALAVRLGRISYGLYVFHILAGTMVRTHLHLPPWAPEYPAYIVATFLVTVALATISYQTLEAPFLRLKGRFARLGPPQVTVTGPAVSART